MMETLHKMWSLIGGAFEVQPLLSTVALILTTLLLVVEYYICHSTCRSIRLDHSSNMELDAWLTSIRAKHFGKNFKPKSNPSESRK
jgi:hypothetical protein